MLIGLNFCPNEIIAFKPVSLLWLTRKTNDVYLLIYYDKDNYWNSYKELKMEYKKCNKTIKIDKFYVTLVYKCCRIIRKNNKWSG